MLKLLFTVAVVALVWFAFKSRRRVTTHTMTRLGRAVGAGRRAMAASAQDRKGADASSRKAETSSVAVDLRPCPRCGAYIAVGTACTCTP